MRNLILSAIRRNHEGGSVVLAHKLKYGLVHKTLVTSRRVVAYH